MEMIKVTSSQIKEIGHDPATHTMAIRFNTGALYHYTGVGAEKYAEFKSAKSHGTYFGKHFKKNEKFPFTRINEKKEEKK